MSRPVKKARNYIVNENTDDKGRHEVRTTACGHEPDAKNQVDIGWHADCKGALPAAEAKGYKPADGCYYCCEPCHEG